MPAVGCFIVCLPDQLQDGLRVDGLWLIARGKWWRIMQLLMSAPCKWWRCISIHVSWLFAYTNKACVRLNPSVKANENITSFAQNWPYSRWSTSLKRPQNLQSSTSSLTTRLPTTKSHGRSPRSTSPDYSRAQIQECSRLSCKAPLQLSSASYLIQQMELFADQWRRKQSAY